jgi:shikimate dehydrogenase
MTEPLNAGVIGFPLKHSISPQFQQPAFDHIGLPVRYAAYEIPPEEVPAFLDRMRQGGWLGCNVTIPHKRAAYEGVDELTEEARAIGAVNTMLVQGNRLLGHNTDATGFMRALTEEARFNPQGQNAVLLGAGGAALAVAVGLAKAGIKRLWIANRSLDRARALADSLAERTGTEVKAEAIALDPSALLVPVGSAALIVNSTSIGMSGGPAPDDTPLPARMIGARHLVYDLVYNPARTPLLHAAEAAGAKTVEGLPMLIYQGAASFERWTGQPAPVSIMMEAGRKALAERTAHR